METRGWRVVRWVNDRLSVCLYMCLCVYACFYFVTRICSYSLHQHSVWIIEAMSLSVGWWTIAMTVWIAIQVLSLATASIVSIFTMIPLILPFWHLTFGYWHWFIFAFHCFIGLPSRPHGSLWWIWLTSLCGLDEDWRIQLGVGDDVVRKGCTAFQCIIWFCPLSWPFYHCRSRRPPQ